jgi:hypothetical protein
MIMKIGLVAGGLVMLAAGFAVLHPARAQGVLDGGFLGSYYDNASFAGAPAFQRRDVRVNIAWGASGIGGSTSPEFATVGQHGLSVSWLGRIVPATTNTYTFLLIGTGSLSLSIRPTGSTAWTSLIADPGPASRLDQASTALTAGQSYDVQIQSSQATPDGGAVRLGWYSPALFPEIIDSATPMGLNIGYSGANDPDLIFADAVKSSYSFQSYADHTDASHPAAVDADGWPEEDATLPIWTTQIETGGTYQLSFKGQSQVMDWLGAGSFSVDGKSYGTIVPSGAGFDAATDQTTVNWTIGPNAPPTAVWFGFGATRREVGGPGGSGVTDVSLMRPLARNSATAHPLGETFTAEFKTLLSHFTAIRFMDYLATLSNQQVAWTDRVKPTDWSQYQPMNGYGFQGKGGSWEYLVELANETGKDVWINIPIAANDDYITKLAQLFAYGSDGANPYTSPQAAPVYPPLNSNLNVYIEYSNEIWDEFFFQHQMMRTIANNMAVAGSPIVYDGTTDAVLIYQRGIAERLKEVSDLFRGVWGNAAMLTTIRPVFEFQYGDAGAYGKNGLDFLENYYDNADGGHHVATATPVNTYFWGTGGGWYATVNNDGAASIGAMYASGMSNSVPSTTVTDTNLARAFGLHEAGYEGGFDVGNDSGSTSATQQALQLSANYASTASNFEVESIDLFYNNGGELPFVFNAVGSTFGIAGPTLHEQDTAKIQGILQAEAVPPLPPAIGQKVPATLPVSAAAVTAGATASGGDLALPGEYVSWTISLAAGGNFTVGTDTATPAAQVIYIDGVPVGAGPWTGSLAKGLHGIRVVDIAATGMTVKNLDVEAAAS